MEPSQPHTAVREPDVSMPAHRNQHFSRQRHFARAVLTLLLVAAIPALAPSRANAATPYSLANGEHLDVGEMLQNGPYRLILQNGGNLVLYWNSDAIWSSGTPTQADTNSTPIVRLEVSSTGRVALLHSDGGVAWHHGPYSGQSGFYLTWNGNVRLGTSSAATWQTETAEQTYTNIAPDSLVETYCFEPGVPQNIQDGYQVSMSHSMVQTKYEPRLYATCSSGVDIQVRYGGMPGSTAYAETRCYLTVDEFPNQCDHGISKYNPAVPHHDDENDPDSPPNYPSLSCHETGHLFGYPDYARGTPRNAILLTAEKSCMRGGPNVVRYSARQVARINSMYPG